MPAAPSAMSVWKLRSSAVNNWNGPAFRCAWAGVCATVATGPADGDDSSGARVVQAAAATARPVMPAPVSS